MFNLNVPSIADLPSVFDDSFEGYTSPEEFEDSCTIEAEGRGVV
jgi:hypothetical protein